RARFAAVGIAADQLRIQSGRDDRHAQCLDILERRRRDADAQLVLLLAVGHVLQTDALDLLQRAADLLQQRHYAAAAAADKSLQFAAQLQFGIIDDTARLNAAVYRLDLLAQAQVLLLQTVLFDAEHSDLYRQRNAEHNGDSTPLLPPAPPRQGSRKWALQQIDGGRVDRGGRL